MKPKQLVPANKKQAEIYVSNSRFIATAAPAFSVDAAKLFIETIREEFNDATHNVPAYIVGHPPSVIEHSSDDGEPAGTAGRPILSILRGSGFGDIAVVVTRYFGGTKLGTGGLVRAYSEATREVLSLVPKAQKISTVTSEIKLPYKYYNRVERLLDDNNIKIIHKDFGEDVKISAQFVTEEFSKIEQFLKNTTNGKIEMTITGRNDSTIMPIKGT